MIEPGLIRSSFAETAVGSVTSATTGRTPSSTRPSAASTASVYDGPLGKLGGEPDAVAKAIEKAITRGARGPATR